MHKLNQFPNLFLAGAPRSGTTYLYDLLVQSDEVFASKDKEPSYFYFRDMPWVIHDGRRLRNRAESFREADYLNLFVEWANQPWAIDGSTYYLLDPACAQRIHAVRPDAKIVIVLREPVGRAHSHYLMERRDGWVVEDFGTALQKELAERAAQPDNGYAGHYHFIRGSTYLPGLQAFLENFGSSNVRVFLFEDLIRDSSKCLGLLCDFIGISRFDATDVNLRKNESSMILNPTAIKLASRYRYSAARTVISRIVPSPLRNLVRGWLMASGPAKAPPPSLADTDRKLLQEELADDFASAIALCKKENIVFEV